MTKKEPNKTATEEEKRELALKLKEFYESAAPGLVQRGVGILRGFGISEQVLGKLTNLQDFSKAALDDPNLTVKEIKDWTAFMRTIEGQAPTIFKTAMREMVKELPRIPGGGRPGMVDEEKETIRKEVLELFGRGGIRLSIAQKRIARNHGISYRSIQRIWAEPTQEKLPENG